MPAPDANTAHNAADDQATWDERYAESDQIWSGLPNSALVAEVSALTLVGRWTGCGEGADAVWLARQGWDVTALDVSRVALDRAEKHSHDAGVAVQWVHAGLAASPLRPFELVSARYPALLRTPGHEAERRLIDAVAPGGTLLVVHHAYTESGAEQALAHGYNLDDYVSPDDVAALLDDGWSVLVDEVRPREIIGGAGAQHSEDRVLRAQRA